jgi:hypothetical protein
MPTACGFASNSTHFFPSIASSEGSTQKNPHAVQASAFGGAKCIDLSEVDEYHENQNTAVVRDKVSAQRSD